MTRIGTTGGDSLQGAGRIVPLAELRARTRASSPS